MVFVDTGAWFALAVPSDPNHARANEWLSGNSEPLMTTDLIVSETVALLRMRHEHQRAIEVGRTLIEGRLAAMHFVTSVEFYRAWILFQQTRANAWSFTDCTSKIVMDALNIRSAFAFDEHFRRFDLMEVVPT